MPNISPKNRYPLALLLACSLLLTGCPDPNQPAPPADPPTPEPQAKLENVMGHLERLLATNTRGSENSLGGGALSSGWSQSVSSELMPPDDTFDTYRAKIKVRRQYAVTMFHSQDEEDSSDGDASGDTGEYIDYDNTEAVENAMIEAPTGAASPRPALDPMVTRENEKIYTYDLEFLNGRWELLSNMDAKTENSIKDAFEYALKRQ